MATFSTDASSQADFEISRAYAKSRELYPNDTEARLAFQVGQLSAICSNFAALIAVNAQADHAADHIMRAELDADTALEIVQAVNASLCAKYEDADPDGLSPAIKALEEAEQAITDLANEVAPVAVAPDECTLAKVAQEQREAA